MRTFAQKIEQRAQNKITQNKADEQKLKKT